MPSVTAMFAMLSAGVSLSTPPPPVPLSRIVPMPVPSPTVAFTATPSSTLKNSLFSKIASFRIGTVIVCVVAPGAKFSVPLVLV